MTSTVNRHSTIHQPVNSKIKSLVDSFLTARPLFFSFIRPAEAALFASHRHLLVGPILDFGCGDGFFTTTFMPPASIEWGLDLATSRIDQATSTGRYRKLITYAGQQIPLPDCSCQTIMANSVFEHLPNLELTLAELRRIIKPKGCLIVTVMAKPWETNLVANKKKYFPSWLANLPQINQLGLAYQKWWRKIQFHHQLYSVKEWQKKFAAQHWRVVDTQAYLSPQIMNWLEYSHFLSLPCLLTKKLFGQWQLGRGWWLKKCGQPALTNLIARGFKQATLTNSGSLFLVLRPS